MLACVIFGALAGVFSSIFALRQGASFLDAFLVHVGVSVFCMVGIPLICLLVRRLRRLVEGARGHTEVYHSKS